MENWEESDNRFSMKTIAIERNSLKDHVYGFGCWLL